MHNELYTMCRGSVVTLPKKHTSVHFLNKESPAMTVKMSLTSPCVHCPMADGTRLHPLHRNHHKMLHIAKPGHKLPQKLQPGCKKISLSCGFWGTRSDNISSNLWIWEEVFVHHHLHFILYRIAVVQCDILVNNRIPKTWRQKLHRSTNIWRQTNTKNWF